MSDKRKKGFLIIYVRVSPRKPTHCCPAALHHSPHTSYPDQVLHHSLCLEAPHHRCRLKAPRHSPAVYAPSNSHSF